MGSGRILDYGRAKGPVLLKFSVYVRRALDKEIHDYNSDGLPAKMRRVAVLRTMLKRIEPADNFGGLR